jgi:hypothetical protein
LFCIGAICILSFRAEQSTSTATLTVMNTEQQPDVSELDFRFDYNGLHALFDNSFEIQNGNVLNQEPVSVNSSALNQNMCRFH